MSRPIASLAALVGATVLAGCMSMPVSGPVREASDGSLAPVEAPADIVVRPPQPGESSRDIVVHFLDAMEASPISTTVAREFLTEEAAAAWNPELGTVIYATKSSPTGSSVVEVTLADAGQLDEHGAWRGPLPENETKLRFPMEKVGGEWRISSAPNALIVRDTWFEQRFRQVSLYFFDPQAKVLVPEPVYLPTGDQLPTYLTRGLLAGPPARLQEVERSFFPPGMTARLSVTVNSKGQADIALQGDPSQLTPQATELMLAQLAWTLRQVPGISFIAVTIGGEPVRLASGVGEVTVDQGSEFDPVGILAPADLFALRSGLLVAGPVDDLQPVAGPFGRSDQGLRSVAVDLTGTTVAGVSAGGDRVLVGSLVGPPPQPVEQVVSGATDLLTPRWDLAGRLWLVDRREGGALVSVVTGARAREVTVPGVTGRDVTSFTVSRDGTRFVAVVAEPAGDAVMESRVRVPDRGDVRLTRAVELPWNEDPAARVRDLKWRSPTSIALLYPLTSGLAEVRTIPIDGSPGSGLPGGTTLRGRLRWLVGSPAIDQPWYAVSPDPRGVVDAVGTEYAAGLDGVRLSTLTYAG